MYQHILLAVALQHWDEFSPHAVAAREAAIALANGSGAPLSVLSVYDYDDDQPAVLSGSGAPLSVLSVYDYDDDQPAVLSLPSEEVSRYRDTQKQRLDEEMDTKMKAF